MKNKQQGNALFAVIVICLGFAMVASSIMSDEQKNREQAIAQSSPTAARVLQQYKDCKRGNFAARDLSDAECAAAVTIYIESAAVAEADKAVAKTTLHEILNQPKKATL